MAVEAEEEEEEEVAVEKDENEDEDDDEAEAEVEAEGRRRRRRRRRTGVAGDCHGGGRGGGVNGPALCLSLSRPKSPSRKRVYPLSMCSIAGVLLPSSEPETAGLRELHCPWDSSTSSAAAGHGHLEILQWAWEEDCPWDAFAAGGGHLEVLKWLRDPGAGLDGLDGPGCPWDEKTCSFAAVRLKVRRGLVKLTI